MKKGRPTDEEIRRILQEEDKNIIGRVVTDPMGSYTGRPIEKWEMPVQDADDL